MEERFNQNHHNWMKRALRLAARGEGLVSPNPMVGSVVVRNGVLVGEGYHVYAKRDHAEVLALRQAGDRSRGADLYVSLEPCAQVGRTPPCSVAVAEAGIKRVFVAVEDPNPLVAGQGIEYLRSRGVEVEVGLCREAATTLNEVFFHFIQTGHPFVTLKLAMTLDGKIATSGGESKWITGPRSRRRVQKTRFASDAILVGIETLLVDDPSLNVRWKQGKRITKVILDSRLRCPAAARVFDSADPVIICHGPAVLDEDRRRLQSRATLVEVGTGRAGLEWDAILAELGRHSVAGLLVEGGGRIAASLLGQGRVNRLNLFYAAKILGSEGIDGIGSLGNRSLSDAIILGEISLRRLGPDFLLDARLR